MHQRSRRRLIASLMMLGGFGCGAGRTVDDAQIVRFDADAIAIPSGGQVGLDWTVLGAQNVSIEPRIGIQPASGHAVDRPLATTTYRLIVPGTDAQREVTVFVIATPPVIDALKVVPRTITPGETAELSWKTTAADRVLVDPGLGFQAPTGTLGVSPRATTIFRLVATLGAEATPPQEVVLGVVNGDQPIIRDLSVSPRTIRPGEPAKLSWEVTGATAVAFDHGLGIQAAQGELDVRPTEPIVYTLTAVGPNGTSVASASLGVAPTRAPVFQSLTVSPTDIAPGGEVVLSWEAADASSVSIDHGVGTRAPKGTEVLRPTASATYTLTAFGGGAPVSRSVDVHVASTGDPAILELRADPPRLAPGGKTRLVWRTSDVERVDIAPGIAADLPASGSLDLSPESTTTYTLIARSSRGSTMRALTITVGASGLGDRCERAIPVEGSGSFTGNTLEAANDYGATNGCTGYASSGPDVAYRVRLGRGDRLRATLTPSGPWDAALYLVARCEAVADSCVSGEDNGGAESLDYTAPDASELDLIVDGFAGAGGPYDLAITLDRALAVAGGDACSAATQVPAAGGTFSSTTEGTRDDYHPVAACTGDATAGPDVVYRLDLDAGDVVEARATFGPGLDGSLYAVTGCDPAPACLAGEDTGVEGEPETLRLVAETTAPHFLVVDSVAPAVGGPHQLSIARYTAETCATAAPLDLSGVLEPYTTAGRANDYSPPENGCTRFTALGPDRVYSVDVLPGDQLQVTMRSDAHDGVLYAVTSCDAIGETCVDGADFQEGGFEEIAPVFASAGRYYVVADGFMPTDAGRGDISAHIVRGDACSDAYRVPDRPGPIRFHGTTRGYGATLGNPTVAACTGTPQAGRDVAYAVSVPPGATLTAALDAEWDASLYLVSDCERSAATCLAGADDGGVEQLTYKNAGTTVGAYHLIVDSATLVPDGAPGAEATQGEYTLTVTVTPP